MLLLLLDTSGSHGGAALASIAGDSASDIALLGEAEFEPRQASVQIIPAIAQLLEVNNRTLTDVDVLSAVTGPGSFTGLRVGLSTVKAMAEATGKPIVTVSRLAAMASTAADAELVHAVLEAGRGEFYYGAYRDCGETCVSESLEALHGLIEKLRRDCGSVVATELLAMSALAEFAPRQIPDAGATQALPLAVSAWRAHRFTDVAALDANYLGRINPDLAAKMIR